MTLCDIGDHKIASIVYMILIMLGVFENVGHLRNCFMSLMHCYNIQLQAKFLGNECLSIKVYKFKNIGSEGRT